MNGQEAEEYACLYLIEQGLLCCAKNYRSKMGEIDLIMRDKDVIVFVEVRYRTYATHGKSVESIVGYKKMRIIKTATLYLIQNKLFNKVPCRFDVIALAPGKDKPTLEWIKNAFHA